MTYTPIRHNLRVINDIRRDKNIVVLYNNAALMDAAVYHCTWMAKNNKLSHNRGGWFSWWGEDLGDRMKKFHIGSRGYAENIAYGQKYVEDVVSSWMDSRGHRNNMLNEDYNRGALASMRNKQGRLYWCLNLCNIMSIEDGTIL